MGSRRIATAALAAALLVPGTAEAEPRDCAPRHAIVEATVDSYVLYRHAGAVRVPSQQRPPGADRERNSRLRRIVFAGRYVAFMKRKGCFDDCWRVWVADLRSGRSIHGDWWVDDVHPGRRLVVDRQGRAAFVRVGSTNELWKLDPDGEEQVDVGPAVESRTLRIEASLVRWRNGGEERSFELETHPPCSARNSSTIRRTALARAFYRGGFAWACLLERNVPVRLGPANNDTFQFSGVGSVLLEGPFVGFDDGSRGRRRATARVQVIDLRDGSRIHDWADHQVGATRPLMTATGAVAWSAFNIDSPENQIRKSDADGERVVLDSGSGIDTQSLTLDGTTLSWRNNGEFRTAELR